MVALPCEHTDLAESYENITKMMSTTTIETDPQNFTTGIVSISAMLKSVYDSIILMKKGMNELVKRDAKLEAMIVKADATYTVEFAKFASIDWAKQSVEQSKITDEVNKTQAKMVELDSKVAQLVAHIAHTDTLVKKAAIATPVGENKPKTFKICESKAIMNRPTFGMDRTEFKHWFDGLVNALVQHYKGARSYFKNLKMHMDLQNTMPTETELKNEWDRLVLGTTYEQFNEDMYYILMEKTVGDAKSRVNAVEPGNGLEALCKIYSWYASTSGLAIGARMDMIMRPNPVTKPEELATALEK